jgi:hypothetical protein
MLAPIPLFRRDGGWGCLGRGVMRQCRLRHVVIDRDRRCVAMFDFRDHPRRLEDVKRETERARVQVEVSSIGRVVVNVPFRPRCQLQLRGRNTFLWLANIVVGW